ncbi:ATP-binding protein [Sedimentibacter sp. MB31-C6]|uniref:ATP-binding protein n=1 Tax=Sedimentibacter sp. MB31-C6 TaxID=3109366 RepID=UPI002DDC9449|nr:AAA family ATPase [Sedimentibacter sp. MB36-C1]WSI03375.1 AAA family ATPase [Sedimentibacter sp. MB36-C1]
MYINKLHLRAFGKFIYKRMYLGKNFNIIYGENEAGKSTIHNFIEAVLYGFDEDEKGKALFNKYKPWNSNLYKGSMSIWDIYGKKYNIAKDFILGNAQVFNKEIDENKNPIIKEINIEAPGEYFFNINKSSFKNTVSIKQLGNKTDKELSRELKEKIVNLSNTRDESVSMDRILASLRNIKEEVGSEDNPKSLLGQYTLRLKELEKAKELTLNSKGQVMFLAMEKKRLNNKVQELNIRIENLNKEIQDYELSVKKDKFLKTEPIKKELDEINEKLLEYKHYEIPKFSKEDYEEALKLDKILNSMEKDRQALRNKKDEEEKELENLENNLSNKIKENFNLEKFNVDFKSYEINNKNIKDMKSKIKLGYDSIKDINLKEINEFINRYNDAEEINAKIQIIKTLIDDNSYENMKGFRKSENLKGFLLGLLGLAFVGCAGFSAYMAYYNQIIEYYGGAAIAIPGILCFFSSTKKRKRALNATKEIDGMECEHADNLLNKDNLLKEMDEIIKESGCTDFDDLKSNFDKKYNKKNIAEEKLRLLKFDEDGVKKIEIANIELNNNIKETLKIFNLNEVSSENIKKVNEIYNNKDTVKEDIINIKKVIAQTKSDLNKLDKEISFEEKRLHMILSSNGMDTLECFNKVVEQYKIYENLNKRKKYCESILQNFLGNENFNDLKEKTKNVALYEVKELDKKEHQLKIFKLNDEKNIILDKINNIDKEIDDIENNVRSLAEVEEEIEFYEDKKSSYIEKIKIADIAAEKINKISDSIKGDFMPLLRKSISDNFSYLTGGKYREVIIDEEMNISVIAEDNKDRYIDIDSLSGGTLDQLYLSLRIGLSNVLSGNQNIPLILDDSFVQYDSKRLKKSIEMLSRESQRRQVILFTCQEREVEYAKELNVKFNYIKL